MGRTRVPGRNRRAHSGSSSRTGPRLRDRPRGVRAIGSIVAAVSLRERILHQTHSGAWGRTPIDTPGGPELASINPANGIELGRVRLAAEEDYDEVVWAAAQTFERWRMLPAPQRGAIVREIGEELRAVKSDL